MSTMFICNHVISGAAIGLLLEDRPAAAFIAGVASHFVLDAIPHWGLPDGIEENLEAQFIKVAKIDGCLGCALIGALLLASPTKSSVAAGIAGACLPDLDKPAKYFFGITPFPKWWQDFHRRTNNQRVGLGPREIVIGVVGFTAVLGAMSLRRRAT